MHKTGNMWTKEEKHGQGQGQGQGPGVGCDVVNLLRRACKCVPAVVFPGSEGRTGQEGGMRLGASHLVFQAYCGNHPICSISAHATFDFSGSACWPCTRNGRCVVLRARAAQTRAPMGAVFPLALGTLSHPSTTAAQHARGRAMTSLFPMH